MCVCMRVYACRRSRATNVSQRPSMTVIANSLDLLPGLFKSLCPNRTPPDLLCEFFILSPH